MADVAAVAAAVLSCRSFDEARERHAAVIRQALAIGPPLELFREHWAPGSEFHASLRSTIAIAAEKAAGDRQQRSPSVDDVFACPTFEAARERFPQIMIQCLQKGPAEDNFRSNWAPSSMHHASLRTFVAQMLDPPRQDSIVQQPADPVAASKVQREAQHRAAADLVLQRARQETAKEKTSNRMGRAFNTAAPKGVPTKEMLLALARGEMSVDSVNEEIKDKPECQAPTRSTDFYDLGPPKIDAVPKQKPRDESGKSNPYRVSQFYMPEGKRERSRDRGAPDSQAAKSHAFCDKHNIGHLVRDQLLDLSEEKQKAVLQDGRLDMSRAQNPSGFLMKRVQNENTVQLGPLGQVTAR